MMKLDTMHPDWMKLPFVCTRVTANAYIMVEAAALDSGFVTTATVDSIEAAFEDRSLGFWPGFQVFLQLQSWVLIQSLCLFQLAETRPRRQASVV